MMVGPVNWAQIFMFIIYAASVFVSGTAVVVWLTRGKTEAVNRFLSLGESLLLGSMLVIGELLLLSLLGLYQAWSLWSAALVNFCFLFLPSVRAACLTPFVSLRWHWPSAAFVMLAAFFFFRNTFFLMDVDSHGYYLYAQKLWLEAGRSTIASQAMDMRVFAPQFNVIPYALGISVFGQETLFPQLIVAFWTVITLLLVYGYVSWRISSIHALAAVMSCLFNDHMFFSGANAWVIINSALIAFLFASAYNFWEAGRSGSGYRFLLGLIFLSQFLANKYQVFYVAVAFLVGGLLLQRSAVKQVNAVLRCAPWRTALLSSIALMGLWFLKNYLATGCPAFPIGAGEMGVLGWNREMSHIFNASSPGPLKPALILKYFTYLMTWPGIQAAKILVVVLLTFPLWVLVSLLRGQGQEKGQLSSVSFWLLCSVVIIFGLCLVSFVDPRHYRYGIAVMAVAAVFSMEHILRACFYVPARLSAVLVLLVSVTGAGIMFQEGTAFKWPSIRDNMDVLFERIHTRDVIPRYYPNNLTVWQQSSVYKEKIDLGAWDIGVGGVTTLSAFFLPVRPQVGLWCTTVVGWKSYEKESLVADDLRRYGIQWLMTVKDGRMVFSTPEEYAQRAVGFDRFPDKLFYNYGFPQELASVKY